MAEYDKTFFEYVKSRRLADLNRFYEEHRDAIDVNWSNPLDWHSTPLIKAVAHGFQEVVIWLLETANANANTKDFGGCPPLYHASWNADLVRILLDHGAQVNEQTDCKETALIMAARMGSQDVVQTLLEYKADPAIRNAQNSTAFLEAATNRMHRVAWLLLSAGANRQDRDERNQNALIRTITKRFPITSPNAVSKEFMVRELLKWGVDIDVRSAYGGTALHWAITKKYHKIGRILLRHGANAYSRNPDGIAALALCFDEGDRAFAKDLLKWESSCVKFDFVTFS